MSRTGGVLVLLAVLAGCVEETDASLRRADRDAAAASGDTVSRAPLPARLVASLTEWQVVLSQQQVASGTVSIDVENNGVEPHALEIEGGGQEWRTEPIQPGEAITLSVVLPPGTSHVYCPLASGGEAHADRGMQTTLQVR